MQLFSKSGSSRRDEAEKAAAKLASGHPSDDATAATDQPQEPIEQLTPYMRRSRERQRKLDTLMSRVTELGSAFEQLSALSAQSEHNIKSLSEFISMSKVDVETQISLESENAHLTNQIFNLKHDNEVLTAKANENEVTAQALRQRIGETRSALESARSEIVTLRDMNRKLTEQYNHECDVLAQERTKHAALYEEHEALKSKARILEGRVESLNGDFEAFAKREFELERKLSETTGLLDKEVKKNKHVANDLEAAKRDLTEVRNENINYRSQLDIATEELEFQKSQAEEEKRKHDDEVYSLNADIENLTSQKRVTEQTLQEVLREDKQLRERNRDLDARLHEIQHLLDALQKSHESDRIELQSTNSKLRDLNMRYNSTLSELKHEKLQNKKYAETIEETVAENKKLRKYKIMHDSAQAQIEELKAQLRSYQSIIEESSQSISRGTVAKPAGAEEAAAPAATGEDDKPDASKLH